MNTFIRTFFICLILTFGFLGYKYFSVDSYSSDLNISKNNPVFGIHENLPEAQPVEEPDIEDSEENNIKEEKPPVQNKELKKYFHKCYFYSSNGNLELVVRPLAVEPSLENSLRILLKGPLISEAKKGVYSEIPANVDLISVRRLKNDIIVDLSANFGNGGGTKSIDNRIQQLSKTVKLLEPNKDIYLYINGKEVEYLGGDGVYVKQPLE